MLRLQPSTTTDGDPPPQCVMAAGATRRNGTAALQAVLRAAAADVELVQPTCDALCAQLRRRPLSHAGVAVPCEGVPCWGRCALEDNAVVVSLLRIAENLLSVTCDDEVIFEEEPKRRGDLGGVVQRHRNEAAALEREQTRARATSFAEFLCSLCGAHAAEGTHRRHTPSPPSLSVHPLSCDVAAAAGDQQRRPQPHLPVSMWDGGGGLASLVAALWRLAVVVSQGSRDGVALVVPPCTAIGWAAIGVAEVARRRCDDHSIRTMVGDDLHPEQEAAASDCGRSGERRHPSEGAPWSLIEAWCRPRQAANRTSSPTDSATSIAADLLSMLLESLQHSPVSATKRRTEREHVALPGLEMLVSGALGSVARAVVGCSERQAAGNLDEGHVEVLRARHASIAKMLSEEALLPWCRLVRTVEWTARFHPCASVSVRPPPRRRGSPSRREEEPILGDLPSSASPNLTEGDLIDGTRPEVAVELGEIGDDSSSTSSPARELCVLAAACHRCVGLMVPSASGRDDYPVIREGSEGGGGGGAGMSPPRGADEIRALMVAAARRLATELCRVAATVASATTKGWSHPNRSGGGHYRDSSSAAAMATCASFAFRSAHKVVLAMDDPMDPGKEGPDALVSEWLRAGRCLLPLQRSSPSFPSAAASSSTIDVDGSCFGQQGASLLVFLHSVASVLCERTFRRTGGGGRSMALVTAIVGDRRLRELLCSRCCPVGTDDAGSAPPVVGHARRGEPYVAWCCRCVLAMLSAAESVCLGDGHAVWPAAPPQDDRLWLGVGRIGGVRDQPLSSSSSSAIIARWRLDDGGDNSGRGGGSPSRGGGDDWLPPPFPSATMDGNRGGDHEGDTTKEGDDDATVADDALDGVAAAGSSRTAQSSSALNSFAPAPGPSRHQCALLFARMMDEWAMWVQGKLVMENRPPPQSAASASASGGDRPSTASMTAPQQEALIRAVCASLWQTAPVVVEACRQMEPIHCLTPLPNAVAVSPLVRWAQVVHWLAQWARRRACAGEGTSSPLYHHGVPVVLRLTSWMLVAGAICMRPGGPDGGERGGCDGPSAQRPVASRKALLYVVVTELLCDAFVSAVASACIWSPRGALSHCARQVATICRAAGKGLKEGDDATPSSTARHLLVESLTVWQTDVIQQQWKEVTGSTQRKGTGTTVAHERENDRHEVELQEGCDEPAVGARRIHQSDPPHRDDVNGVVTLSRALGAVTDAALVVTRMLSHGGSGHNDEKSCCGAPPEGMSVAFAIGRQLRDGGLAARLTREVLDHDVGRSSRRPCLLSSRWFLLGGVACIVATVIVAVSAVQSDGRANA